MRQLREVAELAAPVVALDARAGRLVSILQEPPTYPPQGLPVPTFPSAQVCVHGEHLRPRVIGELAGGRHRLALSPDGARLVIVTSRPGSVRVLDLESGDLVAFRELPRCRDAAWWNERLALVDGGPTVRIWASDISAEVQTLERTPIRSLGDDDPRLTFEVCAEAGVLAASGCDMQVWWPGTDRPSLTIFDAYDCLQGELLEGVLSRDGKLAAAGHDLRRPDEPQAIIVRLDEPSAPVVITDGTTRGVAQLAFDPTATWLALRLAGCPGVRVHRVSDGAVLGQVPVPGQQALAWLEDSTLVIGGKTLTRWSVDGADDPDGVSA